MTVFPVLSSKSGFDILHDLRISPRYLSPVFILKYDIDARWHDVMIYLRIGVCFVPVSQSSISLDYRLMNLEICIALLDQERTRGTTVLARRSVLLSGR
jgi:hypothetical protein